MGEALSEKILLQFVAGSPTGIGAQISLNDTRVLLDLDGWPLGYFSSVFQDNDSLTDPHDQTHIVLDEEDRDALVAHVSNECHQLGGFLLVHPPGRLIQDQKCGIRGEGPCNFKEPLISVREVLGQLHDLLIQSDKAQNRHGTGYGFLLFPPLHWGVEKGGKDTTSHPAMTTCQYVFQDRKILEKADGLEGSGNPHFYNAVGGQAHNRFSIEEDFPLIGSIYPGNEVEYSGLACSVWTDQADDGAFINLKRDIVDCSETTEALRQALDSEYTHGIPIVKPVHAPGCIRI